MSTISLRLIAYAAELRTQRKHRNEIKKLKSEIAKLRGRGEDGESSDEPDIDELRREKLKAETKKLHLLNAQMQNQLIPKAFIDEGMNRIAAVLAACW